MNRGNFIAPNIGNEKGDITTGFTNIKRIMMTYYEQLFANTFDNLGEINNFLKRHRAESKINR